MGNKKIVWIVVGIILFIIIFPLLKPGYIFSLDHVLNPNGWLPNIGDHIYWVGLLSQFFVFFHIPIWIMEKFLVIITFLLPTIGGYLLFKDRNSTYAILFGIFLLLFNPFLYARFIDGQINIYLSFSLLPLFFYFLIKLYKSFDYKTLIVVGFLSLFLCLTSIHNAVFLFFILSIFSIFYIKQTGIKNILKIGSIILLFNLTWLFPFFLLDETDKFSLITQISNFDDKHFNAFQTLSSDRNIYINTLSMQGYWGEGENRFILNSKLNEKWLNVFFIIFIIVIIGFIFALKDKNDKNLHISFLVLAVISYILALGISQKNIFLPLNQLMYDYFPLYSGFREPHKWVMFLVFFYAYYGAYGIKFIQETVEKLNFDKYSKNIIIIFFVLLPILYTPNTLFGFLGQISINHYPKEWNEIKNFIQKDLNKNYKDCEYKLNNISNGCYHSLSFPWHAYMRFGFVKKIVGGWIVRYFGSDILYGDNIEIRDIYSSSNRPESKIIEKYIGPGGYFRTNNISDEKMNEFILDIKSLGIKNIILFHEADFKYYQDILEKLKNKNLIYIEKQNKMITLYKVK